MKKKLLSWMLAGAVFLSGGQITFAYELSDGSADDTGYEITEAASEADLLLPESTEDTTEENADLLLPDYNEELSSEDAETVENSSDLPEEELLTSGDDIESNQDLLDDESIPMVNASINSDIPGSSDGTSIRQSDFTEAEEGNVLVGISGVFVRDEALVQEAIDLINSYRLQACQNGEPDPRNPSTPLTEDDYVPISWSAALEWIAQTRAVESSYTGAHSRVHGGSIWLTHNDIRSWSEVIAWNASSDPMIMGIKQWYRERNDWINQNSDAVTGHYTSMISPSFKSVGLGCFRYGNTGYATVCGHFNSDVDSDTTPAASGKYTQIVQISESSLELSIDNIPELLEAGTTNTDSIVHLSSTRNPNYLFTPLESVIWSSTNESVASVDSSGAVTAISEGRAEIQLSWKDMNASTELYVVNRPMLISADNVTNGVQFSFRKSSNVDGYNIYRRETNSWIKLDTVAVDSALLTANGNTLTYVDTTAKSGVVYSYSVSAYRGSAETSYDPTGISGSHIDDTSISCQNTLNGVEITWTSNNLLQGYHIYRKTSGSSYQKIASLGVIDSYTDQTVSENITYTYKVQGYNTLTESGSNEAAITRLAAPVISSIVNTPEGIRLTWEKKSNIEEYRIYRSKEEYGWTTTTDGNVITETYGPVYQNYQQIAAVSSDTYTDTTAETGENYSYRIEISYNGYENVSDSKFIKRLAITELTAGNLSEGIQLNFEFETIPTDRGYELIGISSYSIYRKTSTSDYQKLTDVDDYWTDTYTDTTAEDGITYTYKLVGNLYAGGTTEGEISLLRLKNPEIKTASNTMSGVKLSWEPVANCNGYNIYRVNSDGSLKRLGNVTTGTTTYIDTDAVSGQTYTYAVKAYKGKASSSYNTIQKTFLEGVTAKAVNDKTGIKITWNKVNAASGYRVYRKVSGSTEGYTLIKTITSKSTTSYIDTEKLVGGRAYVYCIKAYRGSVLSTGKTSTMRSLVVPKLTLTATTGKVQLKWTKTAGAKEYYIYRKTGSGSYKKIATVKGVGTVRYTDTTAVKGKKYTYAIRAHNGGMLSAYIGKTITAK